MQGGGAKVLLERAWLPKCLETLSGCSAAGLEPSMFITLHYPLSKRIEYEEKPMKWG